MPDTGCKQGDKKSVAESKKYSIGWAWANACQTIDGCEMVRVCAVSHAEG
jgi:hypothetical protein